VLGSDKRAKEAQDTRNFEALGSFACPAGPLSPTLKRWREQNRCSAKRAYVPRPNQKHRGA